MNPLSSRTKNFIFFGLVLVGLPFIFNGAYARTQVQSGYCNFDQSTFEYCYPRPREEWADPGEYIRSSQINFTISGSLNNGQGHVAIRIGNSSGMTDADTRSWYQQQFSDSMTLSGGTGEEWTDFFIQGIKSTVNWTWTVEIEPAILPPACSPSSQTASTDQTVNFSASDGDGNFSWSAPDGSPTSGTGSNLSTVYSTAGTKTVTVTSAGQSDDCSVDVYVPSPGPFSMNNSSCQTRGDGSQYIDISWGSSANATLYDLLEKQWLGGSWRTIATNIGGTDYTVDSPIQDVDLYYFVIAKNSAGTTDADNVAFGGNCSSSVPPSPPGNYNLDVNRGANGSVSGPGISCGSDCTESYPDGTNVSLDAIPDSGFVTAWSGCDSSSGNQCSVTMNADRTVTADFISGALPPPPPSSPPPSSPPPSSPPPSSPPPPQPSDATCVANFFPSNINSGESSNLSWSSSNDVDGYIPFDCGRGSIGSGTFISPNGEIDIVPDSQTCVLTVVNSAGSIRTCSATVVVDSLPPPLPVGNPPTLALDAPQNGANLSGSVVVGGWALDYWNADEGPVSMVDIFVDSVLVNNNSYGNTDRRDACTAAGGFRTGCPFVGYTYIWDSATVSNGSHTITVRATDNAGNTTSYTVNIRVNNNAAPPPPPPPGPVSDFCTVTVDPPPPSIPSVSDITVTEPNYCISGPAATVGWTYSDPGGGPQSAYQVQIDDKGSFDSPEVDTGKIISGSKSYFTGQGILQFNVTYRARVRVWNGFDRVSNWMTGSSWKTPNYAYPQVDFSWSPPNPPLNNPVQFTDQTVFGGNPNGRLWSWTFGDGGSSAQQNPSHTYVGEGTYYVTLTATDNANQSCARTKGPILIQKSIPLWKEIAPR
ncbi:MAG: hypothetical protein A2918_02235 [Candidatus Yanofskybacteria bacterium RIFCSPLOWO2_01_FULL_42_49]|uniref:PKD domain-containing protein n=1 Tax=Candidatus Yanofskybacteria bacterium RIFCSPLOWO2_01_FULL_42_49 TaxID=1802694 RepID=A0A1F8GB13_9BACT|nr:MAG: hypothetical protein A2918_02235 [Candidatus Yanofskybacteria bacterium RIFCSPLOWO2_01_FULL_42_49]